MDSNTINTNSSNNGGSEAHGHLYGIPPNAVQCPIQHPYSKYADGTQTIESCCKCESLTKCTLIKDIENGEGINYYNLGGVNAMRADNNTIDRSGLMCGSACNNFQECRYDKDNCEFKCFCAMRAEDDTVDKSKVQNQLYFDDRF